jgi:hypothetical protein
MSAAGTGCAITEGVDEGAVDGDAHQDPSDAARFAKPPGVVQMELRVIVGRRR